MEIGESGQGLAQSIREQATKKYAYMKDRLERESQIDFIVLGKVNPEHVTRDLAIKFLRSSEKYYREKASQAVHGVDSLNSNDEFYFKAWETYSEALSGATEKGSVSKTVELFRTSAKHYDKMIAGNKEEATALGPFRVDFKKDNETKKDQYLICNDVCATFNVAARLFENQPHVAISTNG